MYGLEFKILDRSKKALSRILFALKVREEKKRRISVWFRTLNLKMSVEDPETCVYFFPRT